MELSNLFSKNPGFAHSLYVSKVIHIENRSKKHAFSLKKSSPKILHQRRYFFNLYT